MLLRVPSLKCQHDLQVPVTDCSFDSKFLVESGRFASKVSKKFPLVLFQAKVVRLHGPLMSHPCVRCHIGDETNAVIDIVGKRTVSLCRVLMNTFEMCCFQGNHSKCRLAIFLGKSMGMLSAERVEYLSMLPCLIRSHFNQCTSQAFRLSGLQRSFTHHHKHSHCSGTWQPL